MHFLFDLDGTLTNPFLGITNCIRHALENLGHDPPPAEDLRWCIGPPLKESFFTLLDTDDPALAEEALVLYRERFGEVGLFENEVYPGIHDCLFTLSEMGHSLSVATSKPHVYAKRILEHFELDGFFPSIDGSELDGTRTDKTELLGFIIEKLSLDPANTIMIGDRKHDIKGALNNGVFPIGVLWGYGTSEELRNAGATVLSNSHSQLVTDIEKRCDSTRCS